MKKGDILLYNRENEACEGVFLDKIVRNGDTAYLVQDAKDGDIYSVWPILIHNIKAKEVQPLVSNILFKERNELFEKVTRKNIAIGELGALNDDLLETLKDVAATRSIAMKMNPSKTESTELVRTFERVRDTIARAEKAQSTTI